MYNIGHVFLELSFIISFAHFWGKIERIEGKKMFWIEEYYGVVKTTTYDFASEKKGWINENGNEEILTTYEVWVCLQTKNKIKN